MRQLIVFILGLLILACTKDDRSTDGKIVLQADPTNDYYGEPYQGLSQDVNDWLIYEVNLRAFSKDGDLAGVETGLDSIKALGVNVLWLMPIHPVGQLKGINSPYCIQDYRSIGSEYGNLEDLRSLVDAAHQRGLAVIMDFVANHTAWDHAWINAHPDWYTQDVNVNIVHPPGTNWLDVADLNFDLVAMQDAQIQNMKYWLKAANIDGYRCDYANGVPFEFWQRAIDTLEKVHRSNLLMLAEGDRFNHLVAGFDLRFSWAGFGKMKQVFTGAADASEMVQQHLGEYNVITANQGVLRFTTNHDESAWDQTPVQMFGSQDQALAAFVATSFLGGIPLIYSSQEVGRDRQLPFFSNDPIDWNAHPEVRSAYKQLMRIYNQEPSARLQSLQDYSNKDILAFSKGGGLDELLMIINTRPQAKVYPIPIDLQGGNYLNLLSGDSINLGTDLNLGPSDYIILKKL